MTFFATFALKRPYPFAVLAILISVYGIQAVLTMATDVFPIIKIPSVAAVWNYTGPLPNDVSDRITYYYELAFTSTVEGIEDLESASYFGLNVVRTFQAAELTDKILNFGLPAPIDLRISGVDLPSNYDFAKTLPARLRHVNGIADAAIQQTMTTPTLFIDVERQYALRTGMKEADLATNELVSLSGSQQVMS